MREILGEAPGKPYSRGTRKGNMVFVSGQLGWDANDDPIPGGVGPQTRQALEYVKEVLALGRRDPRRRDDGQHLPGRPRSRLQ